MAGDKDPGAFKTIGELSEDLGVAQHILRYWETKFPQLKPLQRAGNRRYYRPADVAVAERIHHLLSVEGYTVRGAQKLLRTGGIADRQPAQGDDSPPPVARAPAMAHAPAPVDPPAPAPTAASGVDFERLVELRDRLVAALSA